MSDVSRRFVRVLAATTLLVVCPALVVLVPSEPNDACTALRRFAQAYARTSPTLDQMAQFDRAQRIAIFNAVTPAVRAALWQEQLRRFALNPGLSEEQRVFIRGARAELSAAMYDERTARLTCQDDARRLWARVVRAFPDQEHRRAWVDLGSVVASLRKPLATGLAERLGAPFTAIAQWPPCDCSLEWGWVECYPGNCAGASCSSYWGCGPEGMSECRGMCSF